MSETGRIEPRENQVEAHAALIEGLARHDRVQAHMCCGSGKTFTQAFLAREVIESGEDDAPVIVCFVPNRTLVEQNAANFRHVFGDSVDYLGVCTPQESKAQSSLEDPDWKLPLTTDRDGIRDRLTARNRPTVIFSTYQSAGTTRDGLVLDDGAQIPVTLGLFDEAHRTAGDKNRDSLFAFGLFDENISIGKRAFFTATPRIAEGERSGEEGGILSMSDQELYGPRVYDYPFSQGIKDGNVVDYDLWAPVITPGELERIGAARGITDEAGLKEILAELALAKVMEETGQTRFLTYHRRIKDAETFARRLEESYGSQGFTVGSIDGSTPAHERMRLLSALRSGSALVTNCKAFVEGVDAPGLQGVVFVDPKSSVVDIVQAIGRATRTDKADPSKRASIIVPIIYDPDDQRSPQEQARDQGFSTLIQVVSALGASDDKMAETLSSASRAAGRAGQIDRASAATHNMKLLGLGAGFSAEELGEIGKAISVISLTATRDGFAERVGMLEGHLEAYGAMPTTKTDPKLYAWVQRVQLRHARGRLDEKQAAMFDEMRGWSWVGAREKTQGFVAHMQSFYERHGRVPSPTAQTGAERELGQELRRAERHALYGTSDELRRTAGKRASDRAAELAAALQDTTLLFQGREAPEASLSGRIVPNPQAGPGDPDHLFLPNPVQGRAGWLPVFRSGLKAPGRPIGLHLTPEDRERVAALSAEHSVSITLERSGRDKRPFMDGRIVGWHAGQVERGDRPGASKSAGFLVNRLKDRKLAGRPAYTLENVAAGLLDPKARATTLSKAADEVSVEHIFRLARGVRKAAASGDLSPKAAADLDRAPGFSWVEPREAAGLLAPAVRGLVARHGAEILTDRRARRGDTGLSNTLRTVDALIAQGREAQGLDADLDALRQDGHLRHLTAFAAARRKEASDMARTANIGDKAKSFTEEAR